MVGKDLVQYVEQSVLPRYSACDAAHGIDHVRNVISGSFELADQYAVNADMVYVIAAYHDLGLVHGREHHHIHSGKMLLEDSFLQERFSPDDLEMMREAVEDHRASGAEPRSIYGKIVAEADRDISYDNILRRTVAYSLEHCPGYSTEEHFTRCREHLEEKYGENGYIRLWLHSGRNLQGLADIRAALRHEDRLRSDFTQLYFDLHISSH